MREGERDGGREWRKERVEIEEGEIGKERVRAKKRVDKGSMIATINTSSAGQDVLALYYVFHDVIDGIQSELTAL